MYIVISTDDRLVKHLPPLIKSIRTHNDATILCLYHSLTDENLVKIVQLGLLPVPVDIEIDYSRNECRRLNSLAKLCRIFSINALPIEKAIYLDIDTIVDSPLNKLYYTKTSDKGIAAVRDVYQSTLYKQLSKWSKYPVTDEHRKIGTFNSGVLVMDYNKLRENKAQEKMVDFLNKYHSTDQIALNYYAYGDWVSLNHCWNYSANAHRYMPDVKKKIIHWHGKKPWNETRPLQTYYEKYNIT